MIVGDNVHLFYAGTYLVDLGHAHAPELFEGVQTAGTLEPRMTDLHAAGSHSSSSHPSGPYPQDVRLSGFRLPGLRPSDPRSPNLRVTGLNLNNCLMC